MDKDSGALSGSTSLRSPEPVPVSALSGNDPARREIGCWSNIAIMAGTYAALTGISLFAGQDAAFWCGIGAFTTAIIGLWEAGRNSESRDRDAAEGGDAHAAPVPQDQQARAEGIAKVQP